MLFPIKSLSELLSLLDSISAVWYPLSVVALYLGIIIALAEGLNRLRGTNAEFTRKIVHIGSGNVIVLAWWLQIPLWVILGASVIASIVALISYFLPILPSINSVGRKSLGTFFYAISIGILAYYFWSNHQPQYTAIGILVMAWGDGMAAIVGQNWGKHPYHIFGVSKSWEGSLTMMGVSVFVTSLILLSIGSPIGLTVLISLLVGVFATGLEAFSIWGIDNLTVPVGSAIVAFYLGQRL
ncbi:diacylglycerol/polyprenol kinase family protein [Aphanothece sacrum]|uniref:Phosphatidate cytidylyltransferase n=1 Tax=Aphanothece sacrum FPU1 TaxID=1920663 RepID=A0A401IHV5_APHSA|nr:diacylglycerol/polyprenol kinase family protein [Aphanothece sacrum]GBF80873.1 phosphatidate cytidylyltransferase [Aphanothece sacrum FPU1]GBF85181.1 phosphatidate cytidylyltransferase [Aphanothece sacrum FPU3]